MRNFSFLVTQEQDLFEVVNTIQPKSGAVYLIQICSTQASSLALRFSHILQEQLKNTVVIGQSTLNIIQNGVIYDYGTLIIILEMESAHISSSAVHLTEDLADNSIAISKELNIGSETKAVISFADGIDANDETLYASFDTTLPPVPVSGGVSASKTGHSWVLLNDAVYEKHAVAVAIHGNEISAWYGSFNEWNPIGRKFRVTRIEGNRLITLDNKPVYQIYREYLADGNHLPFSEIRDFPLMKGEKVNQHLFEPLSTHDDGSIEYNEALLEGDEVRFCFNHPLLTIEQVREDTYNLMHKTPEAIYIYNCLARLDFMEGNEEFTPLESITSTNGTYCAGEICHDGKQQRIMHHSMTYLALREGPLKQNQLRKVQPDQPEKRNSLSPVFSLIRNAINDVDAMHESMEERLQSQTKALTESYRIDHRTRLPNRVALKERLKRMLLNEHLLIMKINNFPQINEKYGYGIGDQLLRDISSHCEQELQQALGGKCTLYSPGIGEWATVFKSDSTATVLKQKFDNFADRLEHVNFEPLGISDIDHLSVAVAAGLVSRRDYPGASDDDLLLKAIEARRLAKRNNRHLYTAKQQEADYGSRQSQLQWLSCVSRVILNNDVITFAQPIVKAHSHEEIAVECLVRIKDQGRIISPGQFMPIIEDTHLYTRLSRQMIENTFTLMNQRKGAFSINLSPQDLMNDNTVRLLEKSLLSIDNPERAGLEVLETEQIDDYGRIIEVCDHLREMGARIIVDDFGSGYSNIDKIIKLEPQIIKIDGSLIKSIDTDLKQRKVAQTLVQLCKAFGAQTVAEFVHNEEVCKIAEDMGIDYLQGFHLGKPYQL